MKKTLRLSAISIGVLAASLLVSTTSFAAAAHYKGENAGYKGEVPCPAPKMLMSGFYLGGQVGYDSYRVRENWSTDTDADGDVDTANPVINATGFVGGLFAGYGQYFSDYYYLGGEILGNYSGAQSSYSVDGFNDKVNAYGTWGLALLPGLKLNNESLIYVRLGYNWTRMKSQDSIPGASTSTSKWVGGFAYGLGLESLIVDNWSVRTEYTHTNLNSFSNALGTSLNPSNNQFMLGIVYHFA